VYLIALICTKQTEKKNEMASGCFNGYLLTCFVGSVLTATTHFSNYR